jgi:hypothetical protein
MTGKQLYKLWCEMNDLKTIKWGRLSPFDQEAWRGLASQLARAYKVA